MWVRCSVKLLEQWIMNYLSNTTVISERKWRRIMFIRRHSTSMSSWTSSLYSSPSSPHIPPITFLHTHTHTAQTPPLSLLPSHSSYHASFISLIIPHAPHSVLSSHSSPLLSLIPSHTSPLNPPCPHSPLSHSSHSRYSPQHGKIEPHFRERERERERKKERGVIFGQPIHREEPSSQCLRTHEMGQSHAQSCSGGGIQVVRRRAHTSLLFVHRFTSLPLDIAPSISHTTNLHRNGLKTKTYAIYRQNVDHLTAILTAQRHELNQVISAWRFNASHVCTEVTISALTGQLFIHLFIY